ncbi:hypothetical protein [Nocardia tengchongensis]|uniref:hypothetical protein n=1 Tax=Nocardia tengchongensis TaxID=2055889 RepID=UPI0036472F2C
MQKTTLPRGKQIAIEPSTGVTAVDAELAVTVAVELAEAAGAAIAPSGKARAVAATNLIILLDIFVPRYQVTGLMRVQYSRATWDDCRRAAALMIEWRSLWQQTGLAAVASTLSEAAHDALRSFPTPTQFSWSCMASDSHAAILPNQPLCGKVRRQALSRPR